VAEEAAGAEGEEEVAVEAAEVVEAVAVEALAGAEAGEDLVAAEAGVVEAREEEAEEAH